jgi:hypothetical protein
MDAAEGSAGPPSTTAQSEIIEWGRLGVTGTARYSLAMPGVARPAAADQ